MAEFNPNEFITEIVETVKETHEAFIFETIHPYCEEVIQQKIDKQTLNEALLLYKNLKEDYAKIRKDAIDEFVDAIEKEMPYDICDGNEAIDEIKKIAKRMKEQKNVRV